MKFKNYSNNQMIFVLISLIYNSIKIECSFVEVIFLNQTDTLQGWSLIGHKSLRGGEGASTQQECLFVIILRVTLHILYLDISNMLNAGSYSSE